MSDSSENSIVVDGSAAEVSATLFDIAGYPDWSTAIKSVEVLATDGAGRATKAKIVIDAGVMRDTVTLDYDWAQAPGRLEFSLDDADLLTEMTGAYLVEDIGEDQTKVTYELKVGLSMPVPSMMRKKAELATIDLALSQLKKKIEE
ncbi:MAG: SRPBCC family protein [Actinomycetes bacterium]